MSQKKVPLDDIAIYKYEVIRLKFREGEKPTSVNVRGIKDSHKRTNLKLFCY